LKAGPTVFLKDTPIHLPLRGVKYIGKSRVATSWKSPAFFAVLESPSILFIRPGKSLKISGRLPVLHRTE